MLPSQSKRLAELLRSLIDVIRSQLGDIKESLEKQESSASRRSQASETNQREIPRVITRVVSAIEHSNEDIPAWEKTQRKKEYGQQNRLVWATWFTFGATILAFAAAAVYACIAKDQLRQMIEATTQARRAADAACHGTQIAQKNLTEYQRSAVDSHLASIAAYAQALVAMQAQKAFVGADFTVPGNRPYGKPLQLLYHLRNTGKSDASNVRLTGWVTVAKPNSGETSKKPPKGTFSMQIGSIRVGEQFLPDIAGTTRDGNPHGFYAAAVDAKGDPIIDRMELENDISDHKLTIFEFYTISYEDFTARYVRNACAIYVPFGPDPRTVSPADFDKQCNAYNTQTEVQKIPMPAPSKPFPIEQFPEINCPATEP